jgi:hypothetical protein
MDSVIKNLGGMVEPLKDQIVNMLNNKDMKQLFSKDNSNTIINIIIISVVLYFVFSTINAFFRIQYIVMIAGVVAYYLQKNNIYFYKKP